MSNRQERNRRKAQRRRDRTLETARQLVVPGFTVCVALFDWGTAMGIALERQADRLRQAVRTHPGTRWRRVDDMPKSMVDKLLAWFERQPLRHNVTTSDHPAGGGH